MIRNVGFILIYLLVGVEIRNPYAAKINSKSTVLLISFDGFRWDYMDKTDTPNLDFIVRTGVKAKYIKNAFVTKTFPNHFTIVTGLYEESHGIVGNTMYDPVFKSWFHLDNTETRWWNGGEPVWVTNQRSGGTSATVFWPGSDVKIRGQYPTYYMKYNGSVSYEDRVNKVIHLMSMEKPPTFLTLYFEEPDHTGHIYGPDSNEVVQAIRRADKTTGYLIQQLRARRLLDRINVIITSDHGMTNISQSKTIYLEDYISPVSYTPVISGLWDSFVLIIPKTGQKDKIYNSLKNVSHLTVYKKEDIPIRYHYKNNQRIMPILVVAEQGWTLSLNRRAKFTHRGNHGYSNTYRDMNPFFIARGPAFKSGYIAEPFNNVDIYPLICHVLGVEPAPNNGSLAEVVHLLQAKIVSHDNTLLIIIVVLSGLVFLLMSYGIISLCVNHHCKMGNYGHIYDLGPEL